MKVLLFCNKGFETMEFTNCCKWIIERNNEEGTFYVEVSEVWSRIQELELSIFVQCLNPQNYAASANGCSRCLL